MEYKGFNIMPDKKLGFSGFEKSGKWMVSCSTIDEIKKIINDIKENEKLWKK